MKFKLSVILLSLLFLALANAQAADIDVPKNRGPVEVTADKMTADDLAQQVVFEGNAVATQDDVTIHGDRLTIEYTGEDRQIERVVAEGAVRIVQGLRVATGDMAVLYQVEERIILTGSPQVSEGENSVKGDEITLYLNDQRSVVKGGDSGRVNAVFTPKAEESH